MSTMKVTAVVPWFGSNRTLALRVGQMLGRRAWVGIPFAGGCCEIPHIQTRAGVANDLHRHLINLCRVVNDPVLMPRLSERLGGLLFHPDELADAQARCRDREHAPSPLFGLGGDRPDHELSPDERLAWATDYFVCCWMSRSATAGTDGEFTSALAMRWTSSGGGSAKRFRSAVDSVVEWHKAMLAWEFTAIDAFDFIANVKDHPEHGLYCDPPWVGAGEGYRHAFDEAAHRRLAEALRGFKQARVVVRYGDDPLIRSLYPRWTWIEHKSRDQANAEVAEVLIVNGA